MLTRDRLLLSPAPSPSAARLLCPPAFNIVVGPEPATRRCSQQPPAPRTGQAGRPRGGSTAGAGGCGGQPGSRRCSWCWCWRPRPRPGSRPALPPGRPPPGPPPARGRQGGIDACAGLFCGVEGGPRPKRQSAGADMDRPESTRSGGSMEPLVESSSRLGPSVQERRERVRIWIDRESTRRSGGGRRTDTTQGFSEDRGLCPRYMVRSRNSRGDIPQGRYCSLDPGGRPAAKAGLVDMHICLACLKVAIAVFCIYALPMQPPAMIQRLLSGSLTAWFHLFLHASWTFANLLVVFDYISLPPYQSLAAGTDVFMPSSSVICQ